MREIIIKKTLYTFDELSEEARQNAIEERREEMYQLSHEDYFKSIIETMLDELNLETGFTIDTSDVWYDLSHCQGSGVSFTTDTPIDIEQVFTYYIEQHPTQAKGIEKLKQDSNYEYVKNNFEFTMIRHSYHDAHEYTVNCRYIDETYDYTDKQEELAEKVSHIVDEVKNNICKTLYYELDDSYDYIMSDEAIEEALELEDNEYTENGMIW